VPAGRSSYLKYLPPLYAGEDFLGRFLLIFESILNPIDRTITNLPYYFDPRTAPADWLPWLASWLGLVLDETWPADRRRALILAAVDLYAWRGTRRGLAEFLQLYTGVEPEIVEKPATRSDPGAAFRFTVRLALPKGRTVDRALVERIIEAEKPAHAGYALEITTG
jgi:phage tail-like protein